MIALRKYAVPLVVTYLAAWTVSYLLMMGIDLSYYFEYFVLAWTFNAFELPSFIWILSIVLFVPAAAVVIIVLRKRERRRRAAAQQPVAAVREG